MSGKPEYKTSSRRSLFSDLARPGRIRDLARKGWAQLRFRLLAFSRPGTTIRRHRALKGKQVVVYTLGKVGSSSVYHTLVKSFPFRHIYHVHFLSGEWLDRRLPGTPFEREIRSGRRVQAALERPGMETLYICMIRDPVARDLSNVIQNHEENGIDIHGAPLAALIARLRAEGHGFSQLWFETEFADHIGREIKKFPFDPAKGYAIHRIDENSQLLLLTIEAMDRIFDLALSTYLGTDIDGQVRFNDSSDKSEADFYSGLKRQYRLSEAELDATYGAPVCRHFYSDAQIDAMRRKWKEE
ncbi:putative capsular polysaccharide synthesis family protein [Martelella soudanensis]|uniref:putative capsular polysaccharide synthesis family protein n=1 Tax=unclassified Martelella TaxID=2629616 RepID=UPI0015DE21EF|nr:MULTISPECIES: putative capsular polysaccharide synthesis family protein [unclassified Martelella]